MGKSTLNTCDGDAGSTVVVSGMTSDLCEQKRIVLLQDFKTIKYDASLFLADLFNCLTAFSTRPLLRSRWNYFC